MRSARAAGDAALSPPPSVTVTLAFTHPPSAGASEEPTTTRTTPLGLGGSSAR